MNKTSKQLSNKSNHWVFMQGGVILLSITQNEDSVFITLLRYTGSSKIFTTASVWKLPFKLKNIKSYLMYPYLTDEEREKIGLCLFNSLVTDQKKFEELILFRINSIIKAINVLCTGPKVKNISPGNDWTDKLCDRSSSKYYENTFIKEVIEKNT